MPTYRMTAPDGNTYRIEGPPGATDDQVREQILKQYPNAGTPKTKAAEQPKEQQPFSFTGKAAEAVRGAGRGLASAVGDIGEAIAGPFGPGHHAENLMRRIRGEPAKPPEPSYGSQIAKQAGLEDKNAGYTGAVSEALANPVSWLGPGGPVLKAVGAAGGAIGSEFLGRLTEEYPKLQSVARVVGGLIGGGITGVVGEERQSARLAHDVPDMAAHEAAADNGYAQMRQMNVRLMPAGRDELHNAMDVALDQRGFTDITAGQTFGLMNRFYNAHTIGSAVTVNEIDQLRQRLGRVSLANEADHAAASIAIDSLDNWLINNARNHVITGANTRADADLAAALLQHSQGEWATFRKLELLDEARTLARHRAASTGQGMNFINTQRQEIRKILDSERLSRGMSAAARERMEDIVEGTWAANAFRMAGAHAPSGPVSLITSFAVGHEFGAQYGAYVGAAAFMAKYLGRYLTARQIRQLEALVSSEGPIGRAAVPDFMQRSQEAAALPVAQALRSGIPALGNPPGPE